MNDPSSHEVDLPVPDALRIQARLREIDRSVPSLRFKLRVIQWAYVPLLSLALVGLVVGLVLGVGDTRGEVGGVLVIAGGIAGLVSFLRRLWDQIADLEDERTAWMRELFPSNGSSPPPLATGGPPALDGSP
jgi:ABC-type molybdate transport system permease subunit